MINYSNIVEAVCQCPSDHVLCVDQTNGDVTQIAKDVLNRYVPWKPEMSFPAIRANELKLHMQVFTPDGTPFVVAQTHLDNLVYHTYYYVGEAMAANTVCYDDKNQLVIVVAACQPGEYLVQDVYTGATYLMPLSQLEPTKYTPAAAFLSVCMEREHLTGKSWIEIAESGLGTIRK